MNIQRGILALLVIAFLAACGDSATPSPSSIANADVSPSAGVLPAASVPPSAPASPSPSPLPTATPLPTPTPTPSPAPTPVPWKTYTSKRYHYKMQYPPDWVVTPATNDLPSDVYDNYDYPYIYVTRDTVSTSVAVTRTVNNEISYFKSHYKATLLTNQAISLAGGYSGRVITLKGTDDGVKVVIKEIIVAKGKIGYFIALFGRAENAVLDRSLFKKMYLTWRPTS